MPNGMTRTEHLKWCQERAIQEYEFSGDTREGVISMMSDLRKHPETGGNVLQTLCLMQTMKPMTRQEFINFINGFN